MVYTNNGQAFSPIFILSKTSVNGKPLQNLFYVHIYSYYFIEIEKTFCFNGFLRIEGQW